MQARQRFRDQRETGCDSAPPDADAGRAKTQKCSYIRAVFAGFRR
jgi:hypothetical protein